MGFFIVTKVTSIDDRIENEFNFS